MPGSPPGPSKWSGWPPSEPEHAVDVIDKIFDAPNVAVAGEPAVLVLAAKQAMTLRHRLQDARTLLVSTLDHVAPPTARLTMLNPRERPAAGFDAAAAELRPLLLAATKTVARGNAGKKGVSTFLLDALESLRWLNELKPARSMSGGLAERILEADSMFSLLPLREVLRRLDLDRDSHLDAPSLRRKFLREFEKRPRACGVFLVSETEIRIGRDGWRPDKASLLAIDRYLGVRASLPASLKTRVEEVNDAAAENTRFVERKARADSDPIASHGQEPVPQMGVTSSRPTISIAFGRRDDRSVVTRDGRPPEERAIGAAFKKLVGRSCQ
jgi:hypothetical protein